MQLTLTLSFSPSLTLYLSLTHKHTLTYQGWQVQNNKKDKSLKRKKAEFFFKN